MLNIDLLKLDERKIFRNKAELKLNTYLFRKINKKDSLGDIFITVKIIVFLSIILLL